MKRCLLLSTLLLSLFPFGAGSPQAVASMPPPGRPAPTDSPSEQSGETAERERARAMIQARLERLQAEEASLRATLAAIEAGQSLNGLRIPGPPRDRRGEGRERESEAGVDAGADETFTDEQIQTFIAEVYPEWLEQINRLRDRDPEALQRLLQERRPRLIELMVERRDHPGVFEARQSVARSEMMIRRAAWSLARAEDAEERSGAEARLDSMLGQQFDLRLALLEAELEEVETQAGAKRQEIASARANRERLIAERKADLIRAIRERRPEPRGGERPGRPNRPERPGADGPPRG